MVARRLALLVTRLVLLVDDDRTHIPQGREDRRPRSDGDALLAALQRDPCVIALAVAECAVEHGDAVAEHGAKPVDGLRRERDLRHEHDRALPTLLDDAAQQLDVDKGLSAAGDPMEQGDAAGGCAAKGVDSALLCRRGLKPWSRSGRTLRERIAGDDLVLDCHEPTRDEPLEDGRGERQALDEVFDGHAAT